jgi:TPR repeat protein
LASHFLLRRAIGLMLLLALIAGAVLFHREVGHALIWLGQAIAGPEEAPHPQSSVSEPPAQASSAPETTVPESSPAVFESPATSSPQEDRAAPSETQPAATSRVIEVPAVLPATAPSSTKTPSAPVLQPTSQQNRVPAPASSSRTTSDNGQKEYQQAEYILRNGSREAELPEAVRLLWVAVEKGNAGAEVALAELYRQGQGVARNCDQARILLSAAARKGSAEAQKHLDEFVREGCE